MLSPLKMKDFLLPLTNFHKKVDPYVLYCANIAQDVGIIVFSAGRNLASLAEYNDWIANRSFYGKVVLY